jgi:hypothetical protein
LWQLGLWSLSLRPVHQLEEKLPIRLRSMPSLADLLHTTQLIAPKRFELLPLVHAVQQMSQSKERSPLVRAPAATRAAPAQHRLCEGVLGCCYAQGAASVPH